MNLLSKRQRFRGVEVPCTLNCRGRSSIRFCRKILRIEGCLNMLEQTEVQNTCNVQHPPPIQSTKINKAKQPSKVFNGHVKTGSREHKTAGTPTQAERWLNPTYPSHVESFPRVIPPQLPERPSEEEVSQEAQVADSQHQPTSWEMVPFCKGLHQPFQRTPKVLQLQYSEDSVKMQFLLRVL